jgi:hypothetical protein
MFYPQSLCQKGNFVLFSITAENIETTPRIAATHLTRTDVISESSVGSKLNYNSRRRRLSILSSAFQIFSHALLLPPLLMSGGHGN